MPVSAQTEETELSENHLYIFTFITRQHINWIIIQRYKKMFLSKFMKTFLPEILGLLLF